MMRMKAVSKGSSISSNMSTFTCQSNELENLRYECLSLSLYHCLYWDYCPRWQHWRPYRAKNTSLSELWLLFITSLLQRLEELEAELFPNMIQEEDLIFHLGIPGHRPLCTSTDRDLEGVLKPLRASVSRNAQKSDQFSLSSRISI